MRILRGLVRLTALAVLALAACASLVPALAAASGSGLTAGQRLRCWLDGAIPFAETPGYCADTGVEQPSPVEPLPEGPTAEAGSIENFVVTERVVERVVVREEPAEDPTLVRALLERLGLLEAKFDGFGGSYEPARDYSPSSARRSRDRERDETDADIESAVSGGNADASFETLALGGDTFADLTGDGLAVEGGVLRVDPDAIASSTNYWAKGGDDVYYAAGNVGIGTTTPTAPLSLYRSSPTQDNTDMLRITNHTTGGGNPYAGIGLDSNGALSGSFVNFMKFGSPVAQVLYQGNTNQIQVNNLNGGAVSLSGSAVLVSSGNLGIGTTSPGALLAVQGSALVSGTSTVGALVATGTSYFSALNLSGDVTTVDNVKFGSGSISGFLSGTGFRIGAPSNVFQVSNGSQQFMALFESGRVKIGSIDSDVMLRAGNNDVVTLLSGGNVGIGTTSPGALLAVQGSALVSGTSTVGALYATGTSYFAGNVGIGTTTPSAKLAITGSGTGTGRAFAIANSSDAEKFTVLDNGAVGIGSGTTPSQTLEIFGGGFGDGANGGKIRLGNGAAGATFTWDIFREGTFGLLTFYGNQSGADGVIFSGAGGEKMRITPGGNVGIGTTSPSAKLAITGSGTGTGRLISFADSSNVEKFKVLDDGSTYVNGNALFTYPGFGSTYYIGNGRTGGYNYDFSGLGLNFDSGGNQTSFKTEGTTVYTIGSHFGLSAANIFNPEVNYQTAVRVVGLASQTADIFQVQNSDSSSLLNVTATGNVGIGDTSPTGKLTVSGGNILLGDEEFDRSLNFYNGNYGLKFSSGANFPITSYSATGYYEWQQGGVPIVNFTPTGIGVGTTTPQTPLHVVSGGTNGALADILRVGLPSSNYRTGLGVKFDGGSNNANTLVVRVSQVSGSGVTDVATFTGAGNLGIGTTSPTQELAVQGTIQSSDLYGGATNVTVDANGNLIRDPSDANLKENVSALVSADALDKVLALRGVTFDWKDEAKYGAQGEVGFIAQEVQAVLPEAVSSGGDYLSLSVKPIVAVLVEAVKEVWGKVGELAARVDEMAAWFVDAVTLIVPHGSRVQVDGLLCAGDVCVTSEQLESLLRDAGGSAGEHEDENQEPAPDSAVDGGDGSGGESGGGTTAEGSSEPEGEADVSGEPGGGEPSGEANGSPVSGESGDGSPASEEGGDAPSGEGADGSESANDSSSGSGESDDAPADSGGDSEGGADAGSDSAQSDGGDSGGGEPSSGSSDSGGSGDSAPSAE